MKFFALKTVQSSDSASFLMNSHCDLTISINDKSETPRLVFDLHGKAAKAGPGATATKSKSHMNWQEDSI